MIIPNLVLASFRRFHLSIILGAIILTISCPENVLFNTVQAATNTSTTFTSPRAEVLAQWNKIIFDLANPVAEKTYMDQEIYKKVIIQGVKVDSKGNIYVSTARWSGPEVPATLSKLVKKNGRWALSPFPNMSMNKVGDPKAFQAVLGFEIDENDVMWILDQGHVGKVPSLPGANKLVLWDLKTNREIKRYEFSAQEADPACSFLNDIVVDINSGFAYITDTGMYCTPLKGGLIIYDAQNEKVRRILNSSQWTNNEIFTFDINGRQVLKNAPILAGADGVALSSDKKTLYWTNLTGNRLLTLPTNLLQDFSTPESKIDNSVINVATLPSNTDGMTSDREGNIIMTGLMFGGLMIRDVKTGRITRYVDLPNSQWPDTIGWGQNGDLYVITNHLHLWMDGDMDFDKPDNPNFRIWRIKTNLTSHLMNR